MGLGLSTSTAVSWSLWPRSATQLSSGVVIDYDGGCPECGAGTNRLSDREPRSRPAAVIALQELSDDLPALRSARKDWRSRAHPLHSTPMPGASPIASNPFH